MVKFTLRQLEYAKAVSRAGSIARAARNLNVSQPSIAQGLDKLESITGLVLFERHHARGVTLTSQGRHFLKHAIDLLDKAAHIERETATLAALDAGELRLGCFPTLAALFMPGLIRTFNDVYPKIRVLAEEASLEVLAQDVRDGRLDVSLTYAIGVPLHGLKIYPVTTVRPAVMLPKHHRFADKKSIRMSQLGGEPYVMYDAPGSREYFDDVLRQFGLSPRIDYSSQTLEGVRSAVGSGFGFSIAAMRPPHPSTYEGNEVVYIPISGEVEGIDLVCAARPSSEHNRILLMFVEHVVRRLGQRPTAGGGNSVSG